MKPETPHWLTAKSGVIHLALETRAKEFGLEVSLACNAGIWHDARGFDTGKGRKCHSCLAEAERLYPKEGKKP